MTRGLHTLTDPSLVQPLVLTKLYRPRAGRELVRRLRLLEQLQSPPGLVLVIAPAGYGKTTLLVSLHSAVPDLPLVWLALDEEDNDPARFLSAFVAALKTLHPDCGVTALALLANLSDSTFEPV